MLTPQFTPHQQAKRKVIEEAINVASLAGFIPGSPRHTAHAVKFLRGEWSGPLTHRPLIVR